jgi:RNA polymerase sigma-70 factor (ECF subfamily)
MNTEQVYAELHTGIAAFVRRRVRNPADADDIVQKGFLQVHRGLDGLRDDERLRGWIYRAARNAIVDH